MQDTVDRSRDKRSSEVQNGKLDARKCHARVMNRACLGPNKICHSDGDSEKQWGIRTCILAESCIPLPTVSGTQ